MFDNPEQLSALGSIGSVVVGVVGFLILIFQFGQVNRSLRVSAQSALYAQGSEARRALADYPEVRPYILGGVAIDKGDTNYARAASIAEMFLNYYEHTLINAMFYEQDDSSAWLRFVDEALEKSPLAVELLRANKQSYAPELLARAGLKREA